MKAHGTVKIQLLQHQRQTCLFLAISMVLWWATDATIRLRISPLASCHFNELNLKIVIQYSLQTPPLPAPLKCRLKSKIIKDHVNLLYVFLAITTGIIHFLPYMFTAPHHLTNSFDFCKSNSSGIIWHHVCLRPPMTLVNGFRHNRHLYSPAFSWPQKEPLKSNPPLQTPQGCITSVLR